jgi:hypothetical protein
MTSLNEQPGPRFAAAFNTRGTLHTLCALTKPDGSVTLTLSPSTAPERKQVLTVPATEWAKLASQTEGGSGPE